MECFSIDSKEIKGRIDPHYYEPNVAALKTKLEEQYRGHKFGEVIEDIYRYPTFYGFEYHSLGIPVIKGENINELGIVEHDQEFDCISEEIHKKFYRTRLKENDLLFTVRGIIGKVGLFDGFVPEANINANLIKVSIKDNYVPKFYWIFLNSSIGQKLIQNLTSGQVQKTITVPDIKNILIPLPSNDVQNRVVSIMQSAYQPKRQKDAEAQKLLDSIDEYVLAELEIGIDFKPQLTFATYSSHVKRRLDPLYHCQDVFYFLGDYQGNIAELGNHIEYAQSGFAAGYSEQDAEGDGILQIRPTNISDDRRLVFDRNIYVKQEAVRKQPGDILVKGEVLFNNTNSQELVGKSVLFDLDGQYFCSNHITRIKVKDTDLDTDYLTAILNLYQRRGVFYRICTNWNNQSGVNVELLKMIKMPLPTLEAQNKISSEIQSRMNQAHELRQQANAQVEKAKAEVERLILGLEGNPSSDI